MTIQDGKMTIQFDTNEYRFAHGKQPRGVGRWCFFFDDNDDEPFWAIGKFASCSARHARCAVQLGMSAKCQKRT